MEQERASHRCDKATCMAIPGFLSLKKHVLLASVALFIAALFLMAGSFHATPAYADLAAGTTADFYAVLHEDGSLVFQAEPSIAEGDVNFAGSLAEYQRERLVPWRAAADQITSIRFDDSFKDIQPTALSYWFCGMGKATTIDVTNLDTSKATNIRSLFENCSSLTEIVGLENLDTSSCTYFGSLFHGCSSLKSLDLRNFDATHVTVMCYLFRDCSSLETLDVTGPGWRTSALLGAVNAFEGCSSLKRLDLSSFDTSNMSSLYRGFAGCTSLEYLDLTGIDCSVLHTLGGLFEGCENLKVVKLGSTFSFAGNGTTALCALPEGYWRSSADNKVYASADVPNHVAATYTRVEGGADTDDDASSDIAKATVKLASSMAYTGKALKPAPKVVLAGKMLKAGTDYAVAYKNNTNVGTATVAITGKGAYKGKLTKTFKITQAANSAKAAKASVAKSYTVKALKSKAALIALPAVKAKFGTAKWKVTSPDKKKVLTLKNGKAQVKKGAKKGVYTVKLKASVAATKNYKAASTGVVTVKVTVK